MSATIIPFTGRPTSTGAELTAIPLAEPLTKLWADRHLPLIDAAMDLLQADDVEFERRCRLIADAEGPPMLDHLVSQIDRLSNHVGDVVSALAMTAMRIRTTMARQKGQPA